MGRTLRDTVRALVFLALATSLPGLPTWGDQPSAPAPAAAKPMPPVAVTADPLPSWNDGAVRRTLLRFVREVADPAGPKHIPAAERVATFDNDGTLCAERPAFFPVLFLAQRVRDLADRHPEWREKPALRAVLDADEEAIGKLHTWDLMRLAFETHTGMTEDEYQEIVKDYLARTRHPRFRARLTELVYQPMLELLAYLRANDFRVYICTGGGDAFVRAFSEPVYGVPRDRVIGTAVQTEFRARDGAPALLRLPALVEPICEKAGKPVNILRHVGRRPVLAFGNSDGDIQMLQFAENPERPSLSLLLRHDDPDREYGYDARSEQALALAEKRPWVVVSMKNDFRVVFPAAAAAAGEPVTKFEVVSPKPEGVIATGINGLGEVIGFEWAEDKERPGVLEQRPFLARGKAMTYLPLLNGYTATFPAALSDTCLVVGRSSRPAPPGVRVPMRNQAFVWDAATGIRGLGAPDGDWASFACGVTRDGRRVSGYSVGDNRSRACVWDRDGGGGGWKVTLLPHASRLGSNTVAISGGGRYVAAVDGGSPCLWTRDASGGWAREVIAGPASLVPRAVNDSATVVGLRYTDDGLTHAVVWTREAGYKQLEKPDGYVKSEANAVSNGGVVVGTADGPSGSDVGPNAFVYAGGRLRLLDEGGPDFAAATAVNDRGQVAGVLEKKEDD